jgi:hypothetical protein
VKKVKQVNIFILPPKPDPDFYFIARSNYTLLGVFDGMFFYTLLTIAFAYFQPEQFIINRLSLMDALEEIFVRGGIPSTLVFFLASRRFYPGLFQASFTEQLGWMSWLVSLLVFFVANWGGFWEINLLGKIMFLFCIGMTVILADTINIPITPLIEIWNHREYRRTL